MPATLERPPVMTPPDMDVIEPETMPEPAPAPEVAPTPDLEPVAEAPRSSVEADAVPEVMPDIDAATSVDQLVAMLEQMDGQEPQIEAIRETQMYLEAHMTEIITGVLNDGNATYRDLLGQNLARIPDARVREKARELFKQHMATVYRESRQSFAKEAIKQAISFETLYTVLRKFGSVYQEGKGSEVVEPDEAIRRIEEQRQTLQRLTASKDWMHKDIKDLQQDVSVNMAAHVPSGNGIIRAKVVELLLADLKEARLQSASEDMSQGIFARLGKRLGSLFGRR